MFNSKLNNSNKPKIQRKENKTNRRKKKFKSLKYNKIQIV